jgi:hypothetical protein
LPTGGTFTVAQSAKFTGQFTTNIINKSWSVNGHNYYFAWFITNTAYQIEVVGPSAPVLAGSAKEGLTNSAAVIAAATVDHLFAQVGPNSLSAVEASSLSPERMQAGTDQTSVQPGKAVESERILSLYAGRSSKQHDAVSAIDMVFALPW